MNILNIINTIRNHTIVILAFLVTIFLAGCSSVGDKSANNVNGETLLAATSVQAKPITVEYAKAEQFPTNLFLDRCASIREEAANNFLPPAKPINIQAASYTPREIAAVASFRSIPPQRLQSLPVVHKAVYQEAPEAQFYYSMDSKQNPESASRWLVKVANQSQDAALQEVQALNSQVVTLYQQGKYAEAIPLAKRSLALVEQIFGPKHPNTAAVLNNLALLYHSQGQYAQAEPLYKRALAIREQSLGPVHPDTAQGLNNLAGLYDSQGQYAKAEPLYKRALAIYEQALGPMHPDTAQGLNNLAALYESQGQYTQAEPLYKRALAIREQSLGPVHPDTAQGLNNLAGLYDSQGQYTKAEPLYKRALAIREQALGPKHPGTAGSLNNLALLYYHQGQYAKAEPLYKRALAIVEQALGSKHPDTAISLNNLALLYDAQGQYAKAEPLYKRALAIYEQALGPKHPLTATGLNNLATLYYLQGQYAQAEPLYKRALAIREQALGPMHPSTATSLNNLAALYYAQGQYTKAEPLYKRALAIREQALGPKHPGTAGSLNNLAELYRSQGQYTKTEPLYKRALAIREQALGPMHPDTAQSLNNLAGLYDAQGQYAKALQYIRQASCIYYQRILEHSRTTTSGENKENTGVTFAWHLKIAATRLAQAPNLRDALTAETFEISQLFHDGTVGNALAQMAARFSSGNDALADLARAKEDTQQMWQQADAALIAAIGQPNAKQDPQLIQSLRTRVQELRAKLNGLNQRLAQEFPEYAALTIPKPIALGQVQRLLKPGEGLVAFALGGVKSFVWLITPNSASFRQINRTAEDIAKQVKLLRAKLDPMANTRLKEAFPVAVAHKLYQDILGPETARLADVKTLFVVPDGALESLPFSVLVTAPPTGNPEDYQNIAWLSRKWATVTLPTVSSLHALRTLATQRQAANQPFVGFGDPKFTGDPSANRGVGGIRLIGDINSGVIPANRLSTILGPLPGTAIELKANAKTLGAGANSIFLQERANIPQVYKTRLKDYKVVQFATHALVAGEIKKFQLGQAEPAIALTPPVTSTADNDGLLRASQIAKDLKLNADWVVLSACNTAAPDGSSGAPGLSGLAKAFFYSGAKALLVSHWSVVSQPAVVLTGHMFKQWQDNPQIGRAEALRRAQMYVLDNPDRSYYTHPGAWAPFVVAGEGGVGR